MNLQLAYKILRCSRTNSLAEIKTARNSLLRKYHPDVNNSNTAKELVQQINLAWDFLKTNHVPETPPVKATVQPKHWDTVIFRYISEEESYDRYERLHKVYIPKTMVMSNRVGIKMYFHDTVVRKLGNARDIWDIYCGDLFIILQKNEKLPVTKSIKINNREFIVKFDYS